MADRAIASTLSKAERRKKRIDESALVHQANSFIKTAFKLWNLSPKPDVARLVDEMVHSILFSGHILDLKVEPEEMFHHDVIKILRTHFRRAWGGFKSKLPKKTPFSCLLELIVKIKGHEHPGLVKEELSDILTTLDSKAANQLIASAICITHSEGFHQIFSYGASICKSEQRYKKIWIALSCVHTWHPHVSYAVIKCSRGEERRVPFPNLGNHCTAYDANTLNEIPPCSSCCELFSLDRIHCSSRQNLYGNCAEVEAMSKYLTLTSPSDKHIDITLISHTKDDLMKGLKNVKCSEFHPDVVYEPTPAFT